VDLSDDALAMERLTAFAKKRNRTITPQMLKQVKYPTGSETLPNSVGSAPGFACRIGRALVFFLPGVPLEMKPMFLAHVLPTLEKHHAESGAERFLSRVWKCIGIPESELQRLMDPVEAVLPKQAWLGYRTKFPENHLVLYWRAKDAADFAAFEARIPDIRQRLGGLVYTEVDAELEQMVMDALREKNLTVAFAESCTGGLCAQRLTKIPGASDHFWGAAVVYQIAAKKTLLGIELETAEEAVSARCSRELAVELLAKSQVDIAVAITGYLGPAGGTEADPIGTLYIAIASTDSVAEVRLLAPGTNREVNQWGAATHALNQLRLFLAK
jgi:nicotinamide-nucleotide amidase